ncbi:MAG TPA: GAF domain-containing sensor histidine kinase [Anaerolineales bacterium]|nr:GAF domain-containing sensor histidine kinase [Anaerolineales bacterium]
MKQASRHVIQVDWLLFSMRWLLLGGIAVTLFLTTPAPFSQLNALSVIGAAIVYNLLAAMLLGGNWWIPIMPAVVLILDSVFGVAVFWAFLASDSSPIVMVWAALFPSVTASLRFNWVTGVVVAVAIIGVDAGLLMGVGSNGWNTLPGLAPSAMLLITVALLSGSVGDRMKIAAIKRTHAERDTEEKRVKHMREQTRAIYDMASLVSATLNYERVLDAALDHSTAVVSDTGSAASQMVSSVMLFRDGQLRVSTARRFPPMDMKVVLPAREGILAEAITSGEAVFSSEPYRDPELSRVIAFRNCRAMMVLPLQAGFDTYGFMIFAHPREDYFDLDHIELLEAICQHTIVAVQNAKLYQRLHEEKERIVEVEEDARKKLARDLHDGPTQSVAAIAMRANYIRRLMDRDPKNAMEELYKVEELARRTTKEIRHMLFTLRPLVLESQGLGAALQSLADKMKENYNLNVIVEAQPEAAEKLDIHAQGVLFYIAEEAVGNTRKHAEAEHIWVRIKLATSEICALEIQDDGVGFDVAAVTGSYEHRGSLGMVNMRERTELVNGVLHLDSAPGKGTKITILIPLTDEARAKLGV